MTLVDNGDGTVTMANGIVSIVITKASAAIHQINYTYNNSGTPTTYQVLTGGNNGGQLYWEFGGFSTGSATYSVVANTGDYAEVDMLFTSASSGTVDIHFSMLRGSTGFYVTPIWSHRNGDAAMGMGETRDNIYISPTFTWNSIDATRNFQYNVGGSAVGVQGAPVEVSLWTNGIAAGRYEDKYKYSADFGTERVWGWSSVNNPAAGFAGRNIGIWHCARQRGVLQRRTDEARIDGRADGQHAQRRPLSDGQRQPMGRERSLDARFRAVFHLSATASRTR